MSYFKDPLLAKWESSVNAASMAALRRHFHPGQDALLVLAWSRTELPDKYHTALRALLFSELSAAREMREVLRECEWRPVADRTSTEEWFCPTCRGRRGYGHRPDCRLARLLKGSE